MSAILGCQHAETFPSVMKLAIFIYLSVFYVSKSILKGTFT